MKPNQPATTIVIFGASGDLTWRKLIPALYNNFKKGRLTECATILGFARRPLHGRIFPGHSCGRVRPSSRRRLSIQPSGRSSSKRVHYFQGDLDASQRIFPGWKSAPADAGRQAMANRLYYLATAPEYYPMVVSELGAAGMASNPVCWRRIVIEKPFGIDLASAQALNQAVHSRLRREPGLPHRPLPGQGDRPEHPVLPLRQYHLRAGLEPPLRQQRAGDGGRRCGCGPPGRLLRYRRGGAGYVPEPPAATAGAGGDGTAQLVQRGRPPQREGQAAREHPPDRPDGYGPRPVRRLCRRQKGWRPVRRRPLSRRSSCTSTTGAGRACRSTCVRAKPCSARLPRSSSSSSARRT